MKRQNKMNWREYDLIATNIDEGDKVAAIRRADGRRHKDRDCQHIRKKQVMILKEDSLRDKNPPCKSCAR